MTLYAILAVAIALAIGGTYMILRPPATCEKCGSQLPKAGMPGTASHASSGRTICPNCGSTVDADGRIVGD